MVIAKLFISHKMMCLSSTTLNATFHLRVFLLFWLTSKTFHFLTYLILCRVARATIFCCSSQHSELLGHCKHASELFGLPNSEHLNFSFKLIFHTTQTSVHYILDKLPSLSLASDKSSPLLYLSHRKNGRQPLFFPS